ncbi:MAG: polysaccharide biosynthesis/export family protein [Thermoguttaceae bacterium]
MTTISLRAQPVRCCVGACFVALLPVFFAGGCVTTTYHAAELPPEYVARPIERLNKADLSRLTSYSVRSNQIGIGDLLEIGVFSGYGTGKMDPVKVNVGPDGAADVPLIGQVAVKGMTPDEAARTIEQVAKERDVFRTPHVFVRIEEQRKNRIYVSGAVNKQGAIEIPRGNSTLLGAILEAGGLTDDASPDVMIRRPALSANTPDAVRGNPLRLAGDAGSVVLASYDEGPGEQAETFEVNLVSATQEGTGVYYLDDGDVVHVKKRPERKFQVSGLVRSPGEFDMPPNDDVYLVNAIGLAGGLSLSLADSIIISRRVPGKDEPVTIKASHREALMNRGNIRIQENDLILVEDTPATALFQTIEKFFRFSVGSSLALF